jgi:hypothetical protein
MAECGQICSGVVCDDHKKQQYYLLRDSGLLNQDHHSKGNHHSDKSKIPIAGYRWSEDAMMRLVDPTPTPRGYFVDHRDGKASEEFYAITLAEDNIHSFAYRIDSIDVVNPKYQPDNKRYKLFVGNKGMVVAGAATVTTTTTVTDGGAN